jgi:CRISPR-associated exonuclease Cas4
MFCLGEFEDNQYTIEGTSLHDRVHTLGDNNREQVSQIRAIWLHSDRYQIIGKSDLIEVESGELYPVEYKRGKKGQWDNDALQVCAQALCLEEMTNKTIKKYKGQMRSILRI